MLEGFLHHVSLVTRDLELSKAFYGGVLGLEQVARPPFAKPGLWFRAGTLEIHLTLNPAGSFRTGPTDPNDCHFAIRVPDFEAAIKDLVSKGYAEDGAPDSALSILVRRNSVTGFPQLYIRDPDFHVIELNAESL